MELNAEQRLNRHRQSGDINPFCISIRDKETYLNLHNLKSRFKDLVTKN